MLSGYLEIQAAIDSSRSKLCMLSAAGQLGCWIELSHGERTCVREWVGWDGSLRHICKSAEVPVLLVGSRVAERYFFLQIPGILGNPKQADIPQTLQEQKVLGVVLPCRGFVLCQGPQWAAVVGNVL